MKRAKEAAAAWTDKEEETTEKKERWRKREERAEDIRKVRNKGRTKKDKGIARKKMPKYERPRRRLLRHLPQPESRELGRTRRRKRAQGK